ncbi:hypothetical protein LP420_19200 [Massilia sp. B-10]|nr:hypothetical protein LP420_19200 [Massilia sp. B-10]
MNHIKQLIKDTFGASVKPPQAIEVHLKAAADWLLRANRARPTTASPTASTSAPRNGPPPIPRPPAT